MWPMWVVKLYALAIVLVAAGLTAFSILFLGCASPRPRADDLQARILADDGVYGLEFRVLYR